MLTYYVHSRVIVLSHERDNHFLWAKITESGVDYWRNFQSDFPSCNGRAIADVPRLVYQLDLYLLIQTSSALVCHHARWNVSESLAARSVTLRPHTEMYTSVTGHGCKKWHASAAHWNVHDCHWQWVQAVARACRGLKCTRALLAMRGRSGTRLQYTEMYTRVHFSAITVFEVSGRALNSSHLQVGHKMYAKVSAIICYLKREDHAYFSMDYLNKNRSRVTGL